MATFCSGDDVDRSWGWPPATQANGVFGPLREFEVGRLMERLTRIDREIEAFWPSGGQPVPARAGLDNLVHEREEICVGLGHFGLDIGEVERQMAEWQTPHVLNCLEESHDAVGMEYGGFRAETGYEAGGPPGIGPWLSGDPYGPAANWWRQRP